MRCTSKTSLTASAPAKASRSIPRSAAHTRAPCSATSATSPTAPAGRSSVTRPTATSSATRKPRRCGRANTKRDGSRKYDPCQEPDAVRSDSLRSIVVTERASPIWVRDRDGNVAPFETDQISQSLFPATEELGRPDAFLARELTDGVVHFLSEDVDGLPHEADELPELVAKVVRELGQPALARQFEEISRRPAQVAARLSDVFSN